MEGKGKPVKVLVADKEVELTNESNGYKDVYYASIGVDIALIARNQEAIDYLLFNLPDDIIFFYDKNKSTGRSKEFMLLRKLYSNEEILEKEFTDLIKRFEKDSANDTTPIQFLKIPYLNLAKAINDQDKANFNTILLEALIKFQEYYDTTKENRHQLIEGWLPLHIISMACLAYDRGFLIEIDSPLLPMFLVKGECKVPTLKG
jgi:hypothetical protein